MNRHHLYSRTQPVKRQKSWRVVLQGTIVVAVCVLLAPAIGLANDKLPEDDSHGELHVHGLLLEGACSLDMTSVFQVVELGENSRSRLSRPGKEGQPVYLRLSLRDCSRRGGNQTNRYSGNSLQDAIQPIVTLSFNGETDPDMPGLLKITGVSGMALKLIDPQGRWVRIGERGEPMFVTPGDNELTYIVIPVRTPAPLTTGSFLSVTNVEVNYD